ncbi:MAG: hypothetical protein JXQ75_02600 [Phycisphaerae bacterium]|nr:hypothetical protein [Phycisphaerae bacterium]
MILTAAPVYGAMMGSYHFHTPDRILQVTYSALKMPLLLFATSALCLPGFFVLNTILGLRDDLHRAVRAILAGQAGLSVALASLAPLTRFWYCSTLSYRGALLFNVSAFTVATIAGHIMMLRYYRVLIQRHSHHRIALYAWVVTYAFVGIQMGWTLRPFIGDPDMGVTFFRAAPFSNAYVVVARLIFGTSY